MRRSLALATSSPLRVEPHREPRCRGHAANASGAGIEGKPQTLHGEGRVRGCADRPSYGGPRRREIAGDRPCPRAPSPSQQRDWPAAEEARRGATAQPRAVDSQVLADPGPGRILSLGRPSQHGAVGRRRAGRSGARVSEPQVGEAGGEARARRISDGRKG